MSAIVLAMMGPLQQFPAWYAYLVMIKGSLILYLVVLEACLPVMIMSGVSFITLTATIVISPATLAVEIMQKTADIVMMNDEVEALAAMHRMAESPMMSSSALRSCHRCKKISSCLYCECAHENGIDSSACM